MPARMWIKKWWLWCLVVMWVWASYLPTAQAQAAVTLSTLNIQIWPEFDRPSALVIIDGNLAPAVPLPAQVTLAVPAASGGPLAVAVWDTSNRLLDAPYTTSQTGSDIILTFTATTAKFRVEYYDPGITITDNTRNYAFTWKTPYAVEAISIRVQQPFDASALRTEPTLPDRETGDYGLNYISGALGAGTPGQTLQVNISYSKPTNELSINAVEAVAPTPVSVATPAVISQDNTPWLIGLGVVGGLLVGGGAFWYWRGRSAPRSSRAPRNNPPPTSQRKAHRPRPQRQAAAAQSSVAPQAFCTQCGQPTQSGDAFCRHCGAKLRNG